MTTLEEEKVLCGGFEKYAKNLFGNSDLLSEYLESGMSFADFAGGQNAGFAPHLPNLIEWIRVLPEEVQAVIKAVLKDLAGRKVHCSFSWTRDHETNVVFEMNAMGFLSMNIHSPSCEDYADMKDAKETPVPPLELPTSS
jgi:hypothetical protein